MKILEQVVDINVPVNTAYNQWTQFEQFPQFMESIKQVVQLDDRRIYFHAALAGRDQEWDAEIFEQVPDRIIAWHSIHGPKNSGALHFTGVSPSHTQLKLELDYEPDGKLEATAAGLDFLKERVQIELTRFKEFVEKQPQAPAGWRGEIHGIQVQAPGTEVLPQKSNPRAESPRAAA